MKIKLIKIMKLIKFFYKTYLIGILILFILYHLDLINLTNIDLLLSSSNTLISISPFILLTLNLKYIKKLKEIINKKFFFKLKRYLILNLRNNNKLTIFFILYNILSITIILLTPFLYLLYNYLDNFKLIFEYLNNFLNSDNNITYSDDNLMKNSNLVSNEINLLDNNKLDNLKNTNLITNNTNFNQNIENNNLLIDNLDSKIVEINEKNNKSFYKNKIF